MANEYNTIARTYTPPAEDILDPAQPNFENKKSTLQNKKLLA